MKCKVLDLLALDSLLATIILNQHGLQQCYQMLLCGEVRYQTSASKIRQKKKNILSNSGCPWIPWTTDAWRLNPYSLQPKFISQSQIDPKYLKTLVLCWKNGWLMENHGHHVCWHFNWKYHKYPTIYLTYLPKLANYLGYLKKKLSSHVHGRCRRHLHRFLGCARRLWEFFFSVST